MLTIEHCENIHLHLPNGGASSILTAALAAGLRREANQEQAAGAVQTSAILRPPGLGMPWQGQGGRYGGTMPRRDGKPGWHLIVSDRWIDNVKFGPYDHDVAGATSHHDGLANTQALVQNDKEHPAARWAVKVTSDGHEDFYLPAHAELCLLWVNVPELFKKEGWHWSSTQDSPNYAWVQDFENGSSNFRSKDNEFRAVAVRRLVL